ncbi:MAG TPA: zinc metalloprotease HtpX [Azospirillum sp.]|nr:zinc metalloprotease HtpX [Azospirillum sp.]
MRTIGTDAAVAEVHRRHKVTNLLHSALLLGGMVLLLTLCGWVIAGGEGVLWAFAAGALSLLFSPRVSPRLVLGMFGARRLSYAEAPRLFEVVDAISRRAGLRAVPDLWYIASPILNAFTVGSRERAAIAITDGLLRELSLRELAGVLAHEVSHIRNNDLAVMGLADMVANLTRFMALFGTILLLFNLPLMLMEQEPFPWALVLLLTLAPTAGALLQLALSRTREFDADLDAAHLTGDPEGVASALVRIEGLQGRFWEGMMFPGRRPGGPSLLRTHPDTDERVRRLMELRTPPPVLPALEALPIHVPFAHVHRRPRFRASGYWY